MADLPSGTVTFLFTDIEGSTDLWERRPEAMRRSLARHHEILGQAVAAHAGHIFQVIGDAFCIAFAQAPNSVLAAVTVQRALLAEPWGESGPLRVRMALHTGTAELTNGGYASGRTFNRISRVLSAAHGGQILLTLATEELVRDSLPAGISLRDLGERNLRDVIQPEHIFQLMASDLPGDFPPLKALPAHVSPGTDLAPFMESPVSRLRGGRLVGRSEALRRLTQRIERLYQAEGGVIVLSGEPGIGKTRLVEEVLHAARPRGYSILIGRCHEYDITVPYLPIADALEIFARDCVPSRWERLLETAGPTIFQLLSDNLSKYYTRNTSFVRPEASAFLEASLNVRPARALRRLLHELSRAAPVILVLDDLHWADPSSLDLLHDLALHIRELQVLIVGTYREIGLERTHPLNELLMDLNRERLLERVRLRRFDAGECLAFLTALLGGEPPDGFSQLVYAQTEGNPFFIEELVNGLIEDARLVPAEAGGPYRLAHDITVESLTHQIPDGVRAAIGARLNRLSPSGQQVLGLAAVIGRNFSVDVLQALAARNRLDAEAVSQAIAQSRAARFVSALEMPSVKRREVTGFDTAASDLYADFAFDHTLIHQVVYDELNPSYRRSLHAALGTLYEEFYVSREGLYAERLAYHFLASDDDSKAVRYSTMAGDKMYRAYYDPDLALGFYLPALDMLIRKEPSARHLLASSPARHLRGSRHHFSAVEREEVISYLDEVLQAVQQTPRAKALALLANRICIVTMHTGETFAASVRLYEQALLGPDVHKLIVETARGKLVGILEFPGPGGPFPVVMVFHGSPASKEGFADECKRYLSRGLATLRVDLPGYGETTVPTTRGAADGAILKEMVTAVLAHERVESRGLGVLGWSYGPWVAIHLSAVDSRVRAVASISGSFDLSTDELPPKETLRPWIEARWKAGVWPSPDPFYPLPPDSPAFLVAHQVRCPLLLTYGGLDPANIKDENERLAAMVPGAKLRMYPNGIHALVNVPEALEGVAQWMKQQMENVVDASESMDT